MNRVMTAVIMLVWIQLAGSAPTQACLWSAVQSCFVLQTTESEISDVVDDHQLTLEAQLLQSSDWAVISGPDHLSDEQLEQVLTEDPRVLVFEPLLSLTLEATQPDSLVDSTAGSLGALSLDGEYSGTLEDQFEAPLWNGYMDQPAAEIIRLPEIRALDQPEAQGFGVVAIIDTGIDPDHPVLADALIPGYDFIADTAGEASEWQALDPEQRAQTRNTLRNAADQSFASILEGEGTAVPINPSVQAVVDQSFASILEGTSVSVPEAFGHGTMVAGMVRLAAPSAKIMPLRVFDGEGNANAWHVIRAIYYATDHGANVINMSFSINRWNWALREAIQYATSRGVVCVSSAGNNARWLRSWPAAYGNVLGVASTDLNDQLSSFSGRGPILASLAAPGEQLITTYPGGHYAVAWGTSFSAGLVSGATTLLNADELDDLFVDLEAAKEIFDASSVDIYSTQTAGSGRLDIFSAFNYGLSGQ